MTRICRVCNENKPIEDFYYQHARCKVCYKKTLPKRDHEENIRRKGISIEDFNRMLARQGGLCAACKQPETATRNGKLKRLAVDHDHACCPDRKSCGRCVRGLLCQSCNAVLGYLDDDKNRLAELIVYLGSTRVFVAEAV